MFTWAVLWILRWGTTTKQDSRAERAKKIKLYPTFPNVGYKQANISRGLLNILKFVCLVVALINIGRPRPMVLWIREKGHLVMARLVSWLNLAAICHTLYSAQSDFRPLTSSTVCFEIMLGINNRIDDAFTYFEESAAEMTVSWRHFFGFWVWTNFVFLQNFVVKIVISLECLYIVQGHQISIWNKQRWISVQRLHRMFRSFLYPSVSRWSQKWGSLTPTLPGCAAHACSPRFCQKMFLRLMQFRWVFSGVVSRSVETYCTNAKKLSASGSLTHWGRYSRV